MVMTPSEICAEYRQSKKKYTQIQILADLNATTKGEIIQILRAGGEELRKDALFSV